MVRMKNGGGIVWPKGTRIAVMITFDYDAWLLRQSRIGENTPLIFADWSRGMYGPDEGFERCFRVLKEHQIPATFFVPGKIAEEYPDHIRRLAAAGHEVGYHGYLHESRKGMSREEELECMVKSEQILQELTGSAPVGHRAPFGVLQKSSFQLMRERGYLYSSSMKDRDWAYLHEAGRPIVEIPNEMTNDDYTYFYYSLVTPSHRVAYTNDYVLDIWKEEFDALAAEKDKVYCLKLHPQMIGRASRIKMLGELIDYMRFKGAWIATCKDVAQYVLNHTTVGEGDQL